MLFGSGREKVFDRGEKVDIDGGKPGHRKYALNNVAVTSEIGSATTIISRVAAGK